MSMLVDLAGAAAAAGTAAPAAANGSGAAAEEGARVKVTYSYFAVSLNNAAVCLLELPRIKLPGIDGHRASFRVLRCPVSSTQCAAPLHGMLPPNCPSIPSNLPPASPLRTELHVPALPAQPAGGGPEDGGLQCWAGLAGTRRLGGRLRLVQACCTASDSFSRAASQLQSGRMATCRWLGCWVDDAPDVLLLCRNSNCRRL